MVKKIFEVNRVSKSSANECDKENVDIEEAIDLVGHGLYDFRLLFTCCMLFLGAVIDMLGYSIIVPAASCDLQLTLKDSSMLTSAPFAGFAFVLVWGYNADKHGKKKILLITSSAGFILSSLTSFSTNFYMMLVLKFLAAIFSSACTTLSIVYLGECTSRSRRNRYVFTQNVCCILSDFVCFSLAYFILPLDFNISVPLLKTYKPWRLLTLVMTLPLGIGSLMLYFLHESPKFLATFGETEKALEVLRAIHKDNNGKCSVYPVKSLLAVDEANTKTSTSFWESVVKQTLPIFKPPLLWRTLQLFLLLSISCSSGSVIFVWFPAMANSFYTTVSEVGFCEKIIAHITPSHLNEACVDATPINTIYVGMIFSLAFTILNLLSIIVSNWRRTLMIAIFILSGLSCILVDIVRQPIANMIFFVAIQLTAICTGTIGSYYVDIYPTSHRGLAVSLGMMVARLVCLGGVHVVRASVIDHCRVTFYCWAIFVFSGIIAALFLPKDSKVVSELKK